MSFSLDKDKEAEKKQENTKSERRTILLDRRRAVTPTSWKQSAATAMDARKRSMIFTVRQQHSKDRRKCLWTGMSQLTRVQRSSAVSCVGKL